MRLLIDNVKYNLWVPSSEDKFERLVSEHSHDIFGNNSIWFNSKQKIKSQAGVGSIPDALVISFSGRPQWYVVEIELASHSVYGHIVPQINKFINGIKNSSTRQKIATAIYNEIKNNVVEAARLKKAIGSDELHHFISNLIHKDPILVIIIDKITEELKEVISLIGGTKLVEFMTFEREGVGLEVHAHLFEPIISEARISTKPYKKAVVYTDIPEQPKEGGIEAGQSIEIKIKRPKPTRFSFQGKPHKVRHWYEILVKVSEMLYEEDGNKFREAALSLERPQSKFTHYFSYDKRELGQARPVGQSGIFVDTQLNNRQTKDLCHELLAMFGYSKKDLQIEAG